MDADDEGEHSTFKLPSQVSGAAVERCRETIYTAIKEKVCDSTYLEAVHMAVEYNKKKGVRTLVFSVGDKVTFGILKMDQTKTDFLVRSLMYLETK